MLVCWLHRYFRYSIVDFYICFSLLCSLQAVSVANIDRPVFRTVLNNYQMFVPDITQIG